MLRFAHDRVPDATALLLRAARDPHPRVRLEATVAASWIDNTDGARIGLEALQSPLDAWSGPVTKQIFEHTLKDDAEAEDVAQEALLRLWRNASPGCRAICQTPSVEPCPAMQKVHDWPAPTPPGQAWPASVLQGSLACILRDMPSRTMPTTAHVLR